MSATGRRAELVRILRGRKKDKITNLAHELGVSARTIERDLLTLTVDEGYHIETLQGNGGGVIFHTTGNPHKGILSQVQRTVLSELAAQLDDFRANVLNEILESYA